MKKLLLMMGIVCSAWIHTNAQQVSLYSQYMFNGLVLNPAYAGNYEGINTNLMYRQQWSGVEGSPNTSTISVDSPLGSKKLSVGGIFSQDKTAETTTQTFYMMAAYRLPLGNGKLSFGLQGGMNFYRVNFQNLNTFLPDPTLPTSMQQESTPNVGFGLFYQTDKWFAGASAPKLLANDLSDGQCTLVAKEERHYFVTGGYLFDVSPTVKLKPNALLAFVEGSPTYFDINLNALLYDWLWFGASYSLKNSFTLLTQLEFGDHFRFGYSYDIVTNAGQGVTRGSHEFMLNIFFTGKKTKMLSPRYF
ncbi:PorP/SprF family type IX secretion system membrane protein [Flammeovirga agarivorans]|uniref:Type IX secretion system membrane protein PorP/SprF n=1 Tax=Flammeovirga agarivorans TaxID=2726742 RepID=A0A7X8XW40_9BACT|nr:type IX secretion system membrane protein PorP/SprF [Flammeovirga agarivorans]NLR91938.1 type IX secretion system membrane protein PorP/SprF [Flammeovirga agarivorans]